VTILRRLPLSRLLLVCVLVVAVGASLTALAFALGSGPTPPPKPLAQAVHDALSGASQESIQGASADVTLTDHLLEGANLTTGGQGGGELTSNPLVTGASGRLWISGDGRVRLELQSEKGDTQILYDGHTLSLYDAASNTLYRYTPPAHSNGAGAPAEHHQVPSVANVEEAISKLSRNANVSGATPGDVGGQPAYTVHVSPKEGGSLLGGAELSFDAVHGVPLRAAIYSTESASPAIELAASNVSYGAVPDSVFAFTPPSNAKVEEVQVPARDETQSGSSTHSADKPKITTNGHGLSTIAVVQAAAKAGSGDSAAGAAEGLPQVKINGVNATEFATELGTVLSFERSGVRYLLAGSVSPAAIEAFARGL
jgi:outer membrane lipoprotein-sorting protein